MIKRALLVGSSFSAVPILFRLKSRNIHVSVCGSIAEDPCHGYADRSYFIDYSDKDALLRLVRAEGFDYIVPSCNDYSYMSCAWVAQHCGFSGFDSFDVADILHTKARFRRMMRDGGLRSPRFVHLDENAPVSSGDLTYPVLVKPTDSFSGRGVTKVGSPADLQHSVSHAVASSRSRGVVIEEFVDGNLYSHSAFIKDRNIAFDVFVDEFCTVYPYQVDCSCHPSSLSDQIKDAVRAETVKLMNHLNLTDGLLHTQFIASGGAFWIIECMRRCPGDLYYTMIELSTSVDYIDLYVKPFVQEEIPDVTAPSNPRCIGRHTISVSSPVAAFMYSHSIPAKEVRTVPLKESGKMLKAAPFDKLAILFAEFDSRDEMHKITPNLASHISIYPPWDAKS